MQRFNNQTSLGHHKRDIHQEINPFKKHWENSTRNTHKNHRGSFCSTSCPLGQSTAAWATWRGCYGWEWGNLIPQALTRGLLGIFVSDNRSWKRVKFRFLHSRGLTIDLDWFGHRFLSPWFSTFNIESLQRKTPPQPQKQPQKVPQRTSGPRSGPPKWVVFCWEFGKGIAFPPKFPREIPRVFCGARFKCQPTPK